MLAILSPCTLPSEHAIFALLCRPWQALPSRGEDWITCPRKRYNLYWYLLWPGIIATQKPVAPVVQLATSKRSHVGT